MFGPYGYKQSYKATNKRNKHSRPKLIPRQSAGTKHSRLTTRRLVEKKKNGRDQHVVPFEFDSTSIINTLRASFKTRTAIARHIALTF